MNNEIFSSTDLVVSSILTLVSSSLSLIGGFLLIFSSVWIKEIRNNVRQMLVWLTVADIIQAGGYMYASITYLANPQSLPNLNDSWYNKSESTNESTIPYQTCITQSYLTTSASIASFIWTTFLVIYFYRCASYERGQEISLKKHICMHVIAWGVPVIIATVAVSQGVLGSNSQTKPKASGIWCWLATTDKYSNLIWGLVAGKGWEILAYLTTLFLYIYTKKKRHFKKTNATNQGKLRREDELFCFTWIILYCLRMWGTIRFIGHVVGYFNATAKSWFSNSEKYLIHFQSVGDCGQAFCNFVLFCVFDRTVRTNMMVKSCCYPRCDNLNNIASSFENDHYKTPKETDRLLAESQRSFCNIENSRDNHIK